MAPIVDIIISQNMTNKPGKDLFSFLRVIGKISLTILGPWYLQLSFETGQLPVLVYLFVFIFLLKTKEATCREREKEERWKQGRKERKEGRKQGKRASSRGKGYWTQSLINLWKRKVYTFVLFCEAESFGENITMRLKTSRAFCYLWRIKVRKLEPT